MAGRELSNLIRGLLADPGSRFSAAVADWSYPLSREGIQQLQLIDLLLMRWSSKRHPYKPSQKPWDAAQLAKRAQRLTNDELMRVLRPHKHKEEPDG